MAKESVVARESGVNPINSVSIRTRSFGTDNATAIARRGLSLLRRYSGYNGNYQTSEQITKRERRNRERINRAVNNMIIR